MKKSTVIVADLVGSQTMPLSQRIRVQDYLNTVVLYLNDVFGEAFSRPVDFSKGDSVEFLMIEGLEGKALSYTVLATFVALTYKIEFAYGMATDDWSVRMPAGVNAQDGPVFWKASAGLKKAKATGVRLVYYDDEETGNNLSVVVNQIMNTDWEANCAVFEEAVSDVHKTLDIAKSSFTDSLVEDLRKKRAALFGPAPTEKEDE